MVRFSIKLIVVIVAIIAVPVLYYLISPLFINVVATEKGPAAGTTLFQGNFVNADDFHTAEGIAKVIRSDGRTSLRFEDFKVRNGPDLYVYLAAERDVSKGFVDLGTLKGNIGEQNYQIAGDTDLKI